MDSVPANKPLPPDQWEVEWVKQMIVAPDGDHNPDDDKMGHRYFPSQDEARKFANSLTPSGIGLVFVQRVTAEEDFVDMGRRFFTWQSVGEIEELERPFSVPVSRKK